MDKPPMSDQQSNDEKQNTEDRLALEAVNAMCQFGRNQFTAIDKNNDGYLNKIELNAAANSGRYNGEEQKQLRVLAEHVDQLQPLVHNTWRFSQDNKGVAWNDLATAQMWAKGKIGNMEDTRAFRDTFNRNFARIDRDGDNKISYAELETASRSHEFNRADRLNLADAFRKWYGFRASTLPPNFFDTRLKEMEDRHSSHSGTKLLWSMADQLRK